MYNTEDLSKYDYFNNILSHASINYILDPLTGTISRQVFIDFVQDCINKNIPFTLAILDLDNFKLINDNYGHQIGDEVLKSLSYDLSNYLGKDGLVGRYGGDEFIYIDFKHIEYDDNHDFIQAMYENYCVLRKNLSLKNCNPFITGTIGTSTFPKDASTYNDMFSNADKTLYRGKLKGRNCFIIYVESKHKNITVQKLAKEDLYMSMYTISHEFESATTLKEKLYTTYVNLKADIKIDNLLFIDKTSAIYSCETGKILGFANNLRKILGETALVASNFQTDTTPFDEEISEELKMFNLQSILITRVEMNKHFYGYLICTEPINSRIWQQDDKALLFYISKCIANFLEYNKQ